MLWASDIARYFLWKYGGDEDPISNLKLQKLLYYAQGYYTAFFDDSLFGDTIEAWDHGPVVRNVWQTYAQHGSGTIPKPETFDVGQIPEQQLGLLDRVYEAYGQYTAWKLRDMTHEEQPWLIARAEGTAISPSLLREFFTSRIAPIPRKALSVLEKQIHSYVKTLLSSSGAKRATIRDRLSWLIFTSKSQALLADFAIKLILTSRSSGYIDEAIEVLVGSRPQTVKALMSESLPLASPNEDNGDYWYVVIRALGAAGASGDVAKFATSPYVRIREAAVEALSDLGDESSINLLKSLSQSDQSKFIQRIATEVLAEYESN